ncbi:Autophagy-related protein 2 A [Orchesella cincta]|uniref:Autophagy-related protein 2 A n=1 Tax=Orchesella cincta TaxID=48709 RepID=A0A1D2M5Q6_ORCCI|nr:Autophagy-related protein 2 A [Orchesella cincta]
MSDEKWETHKVRVFTYAASNTPLISETRIISFNDRSRIPKLSAPSFCLAPGSGRLNQPSQLPTIPTVTQGNPVFPVLAQNNQRANDSPVAARTPVISRLGPVDVISRTLKSRFYGSSEPAQSSSSVDITIMLRQTSPSVNAVGELEMPVSIPLVSVSDFNRFNDWPFDKATRMSNVGQNGVNDRDGGRSRRQQNEVSKNSATEGTCSIQDMDYRSTNNAPSIENDSYNEVLPIIDRTCNDRALNMLRQWSFKHRVTHHALSDLLKILRDMQGCDLPADSRTLLKTPPHTPIKKIAEGDFNYLKSLNVNSIVVLKYPVVNQPGYVSISIGIDGVPVSRSTQDSFWHILGSCDQSFYGWLYKGKQKPNSVDEYFFGNPIIRKNGNISFGMHVDSDHHVGLSPFVNTNIDLVLNIPLDYLTCMVTRKLITLKRYIPEKFARKPRPLKELKNYKATEYRQLFLYTELVVLKDIVSDEENNMFLYLHCDLGNTQAVLTRLQLIIKQLDKYPLDSLRGPACCLALKLSNSEIALTCGGLSQA